MPLGLTPAAGMPPPVTLLTTRRRNHGGESRQIPALAEKLSSFSISEFISLVGDGVIGTDQEGAIILFNKAAEDMFGFQQEEVYGQPVEVLIPQSFRTTHQKHVAQFAGAKSPEYRRMGFWREVSARRKNGEEFMVEASLSRRLIDERSIIIAVVRDVSERHRHEQEQHLLVSEMAHRFKNIMTVVNSVVSLTARGSPTVEAFEESLRGRLGALARTQQILIEDSRSSADLQALLESEFCFYKNYVENNVSLSGPPLKLPSRAAGNVSLIVHELATNAAKYGALSTSGGKVSVVWSIGGKGDDRHLLLEWLETGGPIVSPPTRRGFGMDLIEYQSGPEAFLEFLPEGVHARIKLPLR